MKAAYITAQTPYGKKEQFILPEIIEFVNSGNEVLVLPLRPENELFEGKEPKMVSEYTLSIPLLSGGVILLGTALFLRSPIKSSRILWKLITRSGSFKKVLKNLSVFGKGLALGEVVKRHKIEHIHAHWAGTTATAAYIASSFSDIPWSFTCHRWDIAENNMLREKVRSAKFTRVINNNGYYEVIGIAGEEFKDKCHKLHVGINIKPTLDRALSENELFTIVVPANMVEVKGHIYLIEAVDILVKKGYKLICNFYGDGELEESLKNKVKELGLGDIIKFNGKLAHDEILALYERGGADCVMLPSIVTENEKEGIPVSLMEAMAYKIPVVATNTGGIPELLHEEAGVIVEEKNSAELSEGIRSLIENKEYRDKIAQKGYERVKAEFSLPDIVKSLAELMQK